MVLYTTKGRSMSTLVHRDGDTYDPARDGVRLNGQGERVFSILSDGQPHTLPGIKEAIQKQYGRSDSESGISARIRDFRKDKFGGYNVEAIPPSRGGLWTYKLHL
jgi:hypothetical protein